MQDQSYIQSQVNSNDNMSFGDFVKGLALFIGSFGLGIIVVPYTLHMTGLSWGLASIFSVAIYFMYAAALIQIISKDGWKAKQ